MAKGDHTLGDTTVIPREELNWVEYHIWANLGWFFCEISFEYAPTFAWNYLLYPSWCHAIGSRCYEKAFTRWWMKTQKDNWK